MLSVMSQDVGSLVRGGAIEGLQGAGFLFPDLGADYTGWYAL